MGSKSSLTVLLADELALMRAGLRQMLSKSLSVSQFYEAGDADSLYRLSLEARPDMIVMDISISKGYGVNVLPIIRRELPDSDVLIVSQYNTPEYVQESFRSGVKGYLLKSESEEVFGRAVEAISRGETYFSERLEEAPCHAALGALCCITIREREVLTLVISGKSNKQIALDLGISPRTVETHRSSVVRKLGVTSVAELTRYALENGLNPTSA